MAVIFMASADLNDLSQLTSGASIATAQARTGSSSFVVGGSYSFIFDFPAQATVHIRVAAFISGDGPRITLRNGDTEHIRLVLNPGAHNIQIQRGTTTIATAPTELIHANTWAVIEAKMSIHSSAGEVTLKVNGTQIYSSTTLNTQNGSTTEGNNFRITGIGGTSYWDDILVDDANWPGLGGIEVIRPNGAGTHQDWDDSDYTKVNTDNDANYIATDAEVSERVSFTLPALAADRKTPKAVGLFTKSQLSGAGAGTIEPYFDNTPGSQLALSTSLQYSKDYQVAMPTEIGLKVIA